MKPIVNIAGKSIGKGHPCYLIAEIGINHNGNVENVFKLIAATSGAECVSVDRSSVNGWEDRTYILTRSNDR